MSQPPEPKSMKTSEILLEMVELKLRPTLYLDSSEIREVQRRLNELKRELDCRVPVPT